MERTGMDGGRGGRRWARARWLSWMPWSVLAAGCEFGSPIVGPLEPGADGGTGQDAGAWEVLLPDGRLLCGEGGTECAGRCVATRTDRAHCGACGRACADTEDCRGGRCVVVCGAPTVACMQAGADGGAEMSCVDVTIDARHCGGCGRACPVGRQCVGGSCVEGGCPATQARCAGVCRDLQTESAHCGACDRACPRGLACSGGVCVAVCTGALTRCGDRCTLTMSDPRHCGRCDVACPARAGASAVCTAGRCGFVCREGLGDCNGNADDGCETDLRTPANCGECGRACVAPRGACVMGMCREGG